MWVSGGDKDSYEREVGAIFYFRILPIYCSVAALTGHLIPLSKPGVVI